MIATIKNSCVYNISKIDDKARKKYNLLYQFSVLVQAENGLDDIVSARFYMSEIPGAQKTTCILRIYGSCDIKASSSARGLGVHRPSVALARAIAAAGIELSEEIANTWELQMREALLAIARASNPDAKILGIFTAHK